MEAINIRTSEVPEILRKAGINEEDITNFMSFHEKYPEVWKYFQQFALEWKRCGHKRVGSNFFINRIRWECGTVARKGEDFKVNNNHSPILSRLMEAKYPAFKGFFVKRKIGKRVQQDILW